MMGPKLAAIAQARTFASVAEPKEVAEMHRVSSHQSLAGCADDRQKKDIDFDPARVDDCPHAKAAKAAAEKVEKDRRLETRRAGGFDYQGFYQNELDRKHKDK